MARCRIQGLIVEERVHVDGIGVEVEFHGCVSQHEGTTCDDVDSNSQAAFPIYI